MELIPLVDASNFPEELDEYFADQEVSTHYQNDVFFLGHKKDENGNYWDLERIDYPQWEKEVRDKIVKEWLVKFYGEEIMKYRAIAISAT